MKKVSINIEYAGLTLSVRKNANGEDVTPLKPISDLFGLDWKSQRRKVTESAFLSKFLGICIGESPYAGGQKSDKNATSGGDIPPYTRGNGEQLFISITRVAAFLMSINPDKVRSHGNEVSADFLEAKIEEWADALHDYEELGVAININHYKNQELLLKQRRNLMALIGTKNKTSGLPDRALLNQLIKSEASNLGIIYQGDLIDESQS